MRFIDIKNQAMAQTGNDADDLSDFLPHLDVYVNEGYDLLVYAWSKKHAGDEDYPLLDGDDDEPNLPWQAHPALADWATWLLYRNGNPQKQQRGIPFQLSFEGMRSRLIAEGGINGKRDTFIGIYD